MPTITPGAVRDAHDAVLTGFNTAFAVRQLSMILDFQNWARLERFASLLRMLESAQDAIKQQYEPLSELFLRVSPYDEGAHDVAVAYVRDAVVAVNLICGSAGHPDIEAVLLANSSRLVDVLGNLHRTHEATIVHRMRKEEQLAIANVDSQTDSNERDTDVGIEEGLTVEQKLMVLYVDKTRDIVGSGDTAKSLATELGCSESAIKMTNTWRLIQKDREAERAKRSQRLKNINPMRTIPKKPSPEDN